MAGSTFNHQILSFLTSPGQFGSQLLGTPMGTMGQPQTELPLPRMRFLTTPTDRRLGTHDTRLTRQTHHLTRDVRAPLVRPQETVLRGQNALLQVADSQTSGPVTVQTEGAVRRFQSAMPVRPQQDLSLLQRKNVAPLSLIARGLLLAKVVKNSASNLASKAAGLITFSATSVFTRLATAKTVHEESPWAVSEQATEEVLTAPEQVVESVSEITPEAVETVVIPETVELITPLVTESASWMQNINWGTVLGGGTLILAAGVTGAVLWKSFVTPRLEARKLRRADWVTRSERKALHRDLDKALDEPNAEQRAEKLRKFAQEMGVEIPEVEQLKDWQKAVETIITKGSVSLLTQQLATLGRLDRYDQKKLHEDFPGLDGQPLFPYPGFLINGEDNLFDVDHFSKGLNKLESILADLGDGDGGGGEEQSSAELFVQPIVAELKKRLERGRHYVRSLKILDDTMQFSMALEDQQASRLRLIGDTLSLVKANVIKEMLKWGIKNSPDYDRTMTLLRNAFSIFVRSVDTVRMTADELEAYRRFIERFKPFESMIGSVGVNEQSIGDALTRTLGVISARLTLDSHKTGVPEADAFIVELGLTPKAIRSLNRVFENLEEYLSKDIGNQEVANAYWSLHALYDRMRIIRGQFHSEEIQAEWDRFLQHISFMQAYIYERYNGHISSKSKHYDLYVYETFQVSVFKKMETDIPQWETEMASYDLMLMGIPKADHTTMLANIGILKKQLQELESKLTHGNSSFVEQQIVELGLLEDLVMVSKQNAFDEGAVIGVFVDDRWQEYTFGSSTTKLPNGTLFWQDGLIVGRVHNDRVEKFKTPFSPLKFWSPDDPTVVVKSGMLTETMTLNNKGQIVEDTPEAEMLPNRGVYTLHAFSDDKEIGMVIHGRPYLNEKGLEMLLESADEHLHPELISVLNNIVREHDQLNTGEKLDLTITLDVPPVPAGSTATVEAEPIEDAEGDIPLADPYKE
jgi:hypothetical protein